MCEMKFVVLLPVVWPKEGLHVKPRTLERVSMIPEFLIDERDGVMYDGAVRVTVRPDILKRSPAMTDERSVGFDPEKFICITAISQRISTKICFRDVRHLA